MAIRNDNTCPSVSEEEAIAQLQRERAKAVLARDDLAPEILAKYERAQTLSAP